MSSEGVPSDADVGRSDVPDGRSPEVDPRRAFLDADHYRSQLRLGQRRRLRRSGLDELDHYLREGWRAGLDPSSDFSTDGYLHDNPDVRSAGLDPLTHWVRYGRVEGRPVVTPAEFADPGRPRPLNAGLAALRDEVVAHLAEQGLVVDPTDLHAPLLGLAAEPPDWFDREWYLRANPDVARADLDPFAHFVRTGFRERRWPNADVAGRTGRIRTPIDRTLAARDIRIETRTRLSRVDPDPVADPAVVLDRINEALTEGEGRRLVIAIGHDDYTTIVGGVQLCEGLEAREFARRGTVHVFVHPSVPLSTLHPVDGDARVRIVLDGVALEHEVRLVDLARAWVSSGLDDADVEAVIVHSMLGHSPESIAALVDSVQPRRSVWWVHDHLSKCPNWLLLRNGVEQCGGPPPTSSSCRLCAWGAERGEHLQRLGELWSSAEWEFLAPSQAAVLSAMSGSHPLPHAPTVVAHLELRRTSIDRPPFDPRRSAVRIGFLGWPRADKGWDVFVRLAATASEGVEFVHLGAAPEFETGIEFVPLRQNADTFGTTVDAVSSQRLDAVLVWPAWAETFSFVTAEAIAGGCEILTHRSSGNVVAMAEQFGRAVVFESVEALLTADLEELLRARRRHPTPAWEIAIGSGLTPAVLDRSRTSRAEV